jgi:hypothetical protein
MNGMTISFKIEISITMVNIYKNSWSKYIETKVLNYVFKCDLFFSLYE